MVLRQLSARDAFPYPQYERMRPGARERRRLFRDSAGRTHQDPAKEKERVSGALASLSPHYFILPGPHRARPGLALVCSPSLITWTPFTKTCFIPVAYWCGLSKVA